MVVNQMLQRCNIRNSCKCEHITIKTFMLFRVSDLLGNVKVKAYIKMLTFANVGTYIGLLANVGAWVGQLTVYFYTFPYQKNFGVV